MIEQPETWTRTKTKEIADCRVFKVREDFCKRESDGAEHNFFVIENPDWVNVIALTKEKAVVFIEQFRQGTQELALEIPGGMVDEGEQAITAARRELLEETGYSSNEFIFLGKSRPNPAIQTNWICHYLALNCEKTEETAFDEHESAITKLVPLAEIDDLIKGGEITHSLVIAGFYYFSLHYNL
ncbi:MAG: NUDIX hydrolase [Acidobacteriota bacterium]|nr:NUDIX hydrolase [Acidobacteriota bacterium]